MPIDYSYVFAPALRLLNGASLNDVYFQYDLLLSLIVASWMKLGLELNTIRVLGQAAYYAAIFGAYLLARRLFANRDLALLLVMALVLGRLYTSSRDVLCCLQVTPLRLDLWLPLLAVVFWRGAYHWSVGLICGLLLLLANKFGIIYTLAYLQLLVTLYFVGLVGREKKQPLAQDLLAYGKRCAPSISIVLVAWIASIVMLSNNEFGNYAVYYQKVGIGFMKISSVSFYWYIPPLFSMMVILLVKLRNFVSPNYLASGFLLTYCVIGNSIYFFGRSHEQAILNMSIVLLFVFFFLLDLISRLLRKL